MARAGTCQACSHPTTNHFTQIFINMSKTSRKNTTSASKGWKPAHEDLLQLILATHGSDINLNDSGYLRLFPDNLHSVVNQRKSAIRRRITPIERCEITPHQLQPEIDINNKLIKELFRQQYLNNESPAATPTTMDEVNSKLGGMQLQKKKLRFKDDDGSPKPPPPLN